MTTTSVVADRGRSNEDFVGAVPTAAVVVDGAFIPGAEGACRHGVAWYAHRLGADLLSLVECAGDETLPALLAAAIEQVTDAHRHTCDPADPRSPWAAVAMVRVRSQMEVRRRGGRVVARVDFLVGDRVVVEFDGMVKYEGLDGRRALAAEKEREDLLRALGFVVIRVVWADLERPDLVTARVRAALRSVAA